MPRRKQLLIEVQMQCVAICIISLTNRTLFTFLAAWSRFVCQDMKWQDSIPEGCISPACQPCVFRWPPLGVWGRGRGVVGMGRSSSEQIWTDLQWWPSGVSSREGEAGERVGKVVGAQVPCLGEGRFPGPMSWRGGTLPCDLSHSAFDVTCLPSYPSPTPCEQTDACENITFTKPFVGGKMGSTRKWVRKIELFSLLRKDIIHDSASLQLYLIE